MTTTTITEKHTNCGQKLHRFLYGPQSIILKRPCFQATCNSCVRWHFQPPPSLLPPSQSSHSTAAEPTTTNTNSNNNNNAAAAFAIAEQLKQNEARCNAEISAQLKRLSDLHVRNAPPVKTKTKTKGGERELAHWQQPKRRQRQRTEYKPGRWSEVLAFQRQRKRLAELVREKRDGVVVLRFAGKRGEFGDVMRQRERRGEGDGEGMKLFLVVGRDGGLRARWGLRASKE